MFGWICTWVLRLFGWKVDNQLPDFKKYVLIAAPHTSNWDFIVGILARYAAKTKMSFLGKGSLFKPPFGWLFRALGGIPVYRGQKLNMVDQMVKVFNDRKELILAMSPEGTRSKLAYWKSGFYHIANSAKVPIVMATLDFKNKTILMGGKYFTPSGDIQADMQIVRDFYEKVQGKNPMNQGPIQIKQ